MRRSVVPLLTLTLLLVLAAPVAAKEDLRATFDAPIAMDTPGGTVILVGITVTAPSDAGRVPVVGSPIYLKLTGRDGDTTRAAAAADRTEGHYTVRIAIPAGGAREAEVGMHGTFDLPMMIMNDPFTFGPITARTSQVAPPLATPNVVPPVASAAAPAPAAVATPAPAPTVSMAGVLAALAIVGVAALAVALIARRRHAAGPTPRSA
jgi:hypothetical protein